MKVLYQSGDNRFFVSTGGGEGILTDGVLVDLRNPAPSPPLKFGSVLNHSPYDDWKPFNGGDDVSRRVLERVSRSSNLSKGVWSVIKTPLGGYHRKP